MENKMIVSCFSDEIAPGLDTQLDVLQDLKMSHLEIRTVDDVNVMQMSFLKLAQIKARCSDRGFRITCVSSPIGKDSLNIQDSVVEDEIQRACEIADVFDCSFIRIFSFFKEDHPLEEALELASSKLCLMARTAEQNGKILVMEGGHGTVGASGQTARILLEGVASPSLKFAYDPGAFVAEGLRPFDECFGLVEPYISYMHIKDARFGENSRVVAGTGDAQVETALNALKNREDFVVSLEPHLAYAGAKRGFSGEMPFRSAHKALIEMLEANKIEFS